MAEFVAETGGIRREISSVHLLVHPQPTKQEASGGGAAMN